jgi:hypothetical protein
MAKTTAFRNWNHSAMSTPQVVAVPRNPLGEDWKRFLPYREQNDPGERFLSKYFKDLME